MNASHLDQLINAVLYEGYILYPYRSTSKKNQQRFTFGRVYPEDYCAAQNGAESFLMQTECLVRRRGPTPTLDISVRFLQPMKREVVQVVATEVESNNYESDFQAVAELRVDDQIFHTWMEAVERMVKPLSLVLTDSSSNRKDCSFCFPASVETEPIKAQQGRTVGMIRRRQQGIKGLIEIFAEPLDSETFKITVRISNHTPVPEREVHDSDAILMRTLASTHTILCLHEGEFISQTDPPVACSEAVAACKNIGTWPVLVGDEEKGERDTMLSSPIILGDYPEIAPESPGDLFDGTEIDEILTLRIATMTDEEKWEMRGLDGLARRLLERTETMSNDHLLKLHGVMRTNQYSFDEAIFGGSTKLEGVYRGDTYLRVGNHVRIQPRERADAMDMMLAGKTAVIEAVEQDAEGQVHLALVLPDDPGMDLGLMRQPGHRFFYTLDEVEPLEEGK